MSQNAMLNRMRPYMATQGHTRPHKHNFSHCTFSSHLEHPKNNNNKASFRTFEYSSRSKRLFHSFSFELWGQKWLASVSGYLIEIRIAGSYNKTNLTYKRYARGNHKKVTSSSNLKVSSAPSILVLRWPHVHVNYFAARISFSQINSWIV